MMVHYDTCARCRRSWPCTNEACAEDGGLCRECEGEQDEAKTIIGTCNGIDIPLACVKTIGPLFMRAGNVFREVELKDGSVVSNGSNTIYAIPGGKLMILMKDE